MSFYRLVEPLESRRLLTTYAIADYYPAFAGATWSRFGGVGSTTGATSTTTIFRDKLGSTPVLRADETLHLPGGPDGSSSTYFRLDSKGINIYHSESTQNDGSSLIFDFKSPLLYIPATLDSSNSTSSGNEVQANVVISSPQGTFRGSGRVWTSQQLFAPVNTTIMDGRQAVEALHLMVNMSFELTGTMNGKDWFIEGTTGEDLNLVRGLGTVYTKQTASLTAHQGEGVGRSNSYVDLRLEDTNLFRPDVDISLDGNGALTITGTSGADDISVLLRKESVLVLSNGLLREPQNVYPVKSIKSISVSGGEGNDWINISTYGPSDPVGGGYLPGSYVDAGLGNDTILGGESKDTLSGGAGKDNIHGGGGDDRINGHGTHDQLAGGDGDDRIYGGDGNDSIEGGTGTDRVWAGAGDDVLAGNGSNDRLLGESGNDFLKGHAGADLLNGGDDDDTAISDSLDTLLEIEA